MTRAGRLIRAFWRTPVVRAAGDDSLREAIAALHRELAAIGQALADVGPQVALVQKHLEQLFVLRREELDAPARMDVLDRVLNMNAVSEHVSEAVARATLVDDPVPHALISGLLPPQVYDAVTAAIPLPVLFDDAGTGGCELRVPPALAPTYSIATWVFMTEVVKDVLAPALVERFQQPLQRHVAALCPSLDSATSGSLRLTPAPGRIVRRWREGEAPFGRTRPWDFVTAAVSLAPSAGGEHDGIRLRGASVEIPFHPNSALVVVGPAGSHEYLPIPGTAPPETVRYSYEFSLVPGPEVRRRLLAAMDPAARQTWESRHGGPRPEHL